MKEKEYYTSGELAKLFDIPKQTMFYYDKMGLLTPEFVAENGYRYYAAQQYLTLEIILFLRRLDIAVPDIKEFLQHRSRENLLKLLSSKEKNFLENIGRMQSILHAVQSYKKQLECSRFLPLDRVLLENRTDCRLYLTPIPENRRGGSHAIRLRAKHVNEVFSKSCCKDQPTGWVIAKEDFFSENFSHSSAVVTQSGDEDSPLPCNFIRPSGLYCSILIKGSYFLRAREAYDRLTDFMKRNALSPEGDIFLFPVVSYWAENDPAEYINSLSVQVSNSTTPPPPMKIAIFPTRHRYKFRKRKYRTQKSSRIPNRIHELFHF